MHTDVFRLNEAPALRGFDFIDQVALSVVLRAFLSSP